MLQMSRGNTVASRELAARPKTEALQRRMRSWPAFRSIRVALSVIIATAVTLTLGMIARPVVAEPVVGCPLGLEKGKFWLRSIAKYVDHTERYNPQTGAMEDLPAGWHSRKTQLPIRLGYGLTERIDVGLVLPFAWRDLRMQKQGNWVEKDSSGFEDIWVSAKYKFLESYEPKGSFEERHACVALAHRFDTASDGKCVNGLGTGADAWRLALLFHADFSEKSAVCAHLTYDMIGNARTIDGFGKSGYHYADRMGYKFFVERELADKWAAIFGPTGWFETSQTTQPNDDGVGYRAHSHNFALKVEYHPNGAESEHQKLMVGLSMPYSAKSQFTPDIGYSFGGMWTW